MGWGEPWQVRDPQHERKDGLACLLISDPKASLRKQTAVARCTAAAA